MVGSSRVRRCLIGGTGTLAVLGGLGGVALAGHKGQITPVTESHAGATLLARTMMVDRASC